MTKSPAGDTRPPGTEAKSLQAHSLGLESLLDDGSFDDRAPPARPGSDQCWRPVIPSVSRTVRKSPSAYAFLTRTRTLQYWFVEMPTTRADGMNQIP